jgi:cytochrome c-type biogenesis protein CcmH/NrfG
MVDQDASSSANSPVEESQNEIAALQRLRNSYRADPTTGADWAVLLAVESTLRDAMDAQNRV